MRILWMLIGAVLLMSGTAIAQNRGDISGGYRFAQSEGVSYPAGWYADVTLHANDLVSIVGDVGGAYKSDSLGAGSVTQSVDSSIHTFMGGVKVNVRTRDTDVVAFGQALVGAATLKLSTSGSGIALSRSTTEPALGASAGVDVNGGIPVGLRFEIGWLRVFEDEASNAFTFSIGAKFRF